MYLPTQLPDLVGNATVLQNYLEMNLKPSLSQVSGLSKLTHIHVLLPRSSLLMCVCVCLVTYVYAGEGHLGQH